MDFIPKGNPELVLSENPTKIVRHDLTKVEGDAVSDGDRRYRSCHDAFLSKESDSGTTKQRDSRERTRFSPHGARAPVLDSA